VTSRLRLVTLLSVFIALFVCGRANAEPWFAVQTGFKCAQCHVNPAGGGMRNTFGQIWSQTQLPEKHLDIGDPWTGEVSKYFAVGGNLRASASVTKTPHQKTLSSFDVDEMRLYVEVRAIPERLSLYVDQHIAPGGSINSEAYGRLWTSSHQWYVQAGQMYLPYGIRLQDDTAFTRQVTGINFATPDRGVQVGFENPNWSAQLAVSDGTAGGSSTPDGKQYSLRAEHVQSIWRLGASVNFNNSTGESRQMQNIFGGVRTGPIAWLAEADYISDDNFPTKRKQIVGLLEANWTIRQGHNLKLTGEYFDPDRDVDRARDYQDRWSIVYEYTPFQFLQLRVGGRNYDGIPQNDGQNRRLVFAQINGYF
jgi:hypothetical protein